MKPRASIRRRISPQRGRIAALLLAGIAACAPASSRLEAVTVTGEEIVFAYTGDEAGEAAHQASLYCANLGRSARLREEVRESDGRRVATFECRGENGS